MLRQLIVLLLAVLQLCLQQLHGPSVRSFGRKHHRPPEARREGQRWEVHGDDSRPDGDSLPRQRACEDA